MRAAGYVYAFLANCKGAEDAEEESVRKLNGIISEEL